MNESKLSELKQPNRWSRVLKALDKRRKQHSPDLLRRKSRSNLRLERCTRQSRNCLNASKRRTTGFCSASKPISAPRLEHRRGPRNKNSSWKSCEQSGKSSRPRREIGLKRNSNSSLRFKH